MRLYLPLGAALFLAFATSCSSSAATDCVAVTAAGTETSTATLAEVRTDRSGSRTVRSAEGVTVTTKKDGELEIVGVDGKKIVVASDGTVRSAERDVRVVLSDGTSKVFDLVSQVLVTEEKWTEQRSGGGSAGGASAARTSAASVGEAGEVHEDEGDGPKATICHVPPGNPANQHTLSVGESAVSAHLKHGDYEGECDPARAASAEKDHGNGKKDDGDDGGSSRAAARGKKK